MTIQFDDIVPQYTPDVQVETDWTGQLSALPTTTKKTLLVGHKTSAGSATAGVVTQIYGVNHAIALFGIGSNLAMMAEAFMRNAPKAPLYGVAYAEGGAAVAGTGVVTLATNASSSGTLTVWVAGRRFQVGIASGDTPTAVGDLIVAEINAHPNLGVTASNTTGAVTMTSRCKGPQANTFRYRSKITCSGMTSTDTGAAFASGATAGDPTATLAGVQGERYHIIVLDTHDDSTTLGVLSAHCELQSTVAVQKWGIGIVGHTGTAAAAQTLAGTDDSYRSQVVHHQSGDQPCFELAAAFAGVRAKTAANMPIDYAELKGITAQYDETARPTAAEIEADLAGGVTAVTPTKSGGAQVVRSVITRQTTPSFRDHMVPEISDYTDEFIITTFRSRMMGRPLKSGSPPASSTTVTPKRATALLNECLAKLDGIDFLQGVQSSIDAGNNFAEINATDPNRVDAAFDFWPVAAAHLFAFKKSYRTTAP